MVCSASVVALVALEHYLQKILSFSPCTNPMTLNSVFNLHVMRWRVREYRKRLGGGRGGDVEGKAGWNCPRAPSFFWGEKEND